MKMFLSTLLVGGIVTGILGFIIRWSEFKTYFVNVEIGAIVSSFIWLVGVGLIFSVISQAGFFAYLFLHQFGLGVFRSLWNPVQILLIAFVLFDLVYFRFEAFAGKGESLVPYIGLAVFILVAGLIVAYMKARQTNRKTFVSALFFMVVVTILEWLPVLQANDENWLFLMIYPLIACNAYQLLILPTYNRLSEEERKAKAPKQEPAAQPANKKKKKK